MAQSGVLKSSSRRSIVWAILLIVFGFLAIALPLASSWAVLTIVAWLIALSGVFQFVDAFHSKGLGHILWRLLVAILYFIVGLYFLFHPLLGIAAFTLVVAIFFIGEGIFDLVTYFQTRNSPGAGWILVDGIITLLLGLLVWRHWPSSSLWVIGTLVGISMIMTGTTRLMLALVARRLALDIP